MTTRAVAANVDPLSLERQVCFALAITNRAGAVPRGCPAGYMPEMNVLCTIGDDSTRSDQPIMKN